MEQQVTTVTTEPVEPAPVVRVEHPQKVYQTKKAIFRAYQVIWYILGLVEVLLVFRIILKALGANLYSGFTSLIYTLSEPLAAPFLGVFRVSVSQGSVFEWSTFLAGIVYALIAYGLVQLMQLIKPTNPQEVHENVDQVPV